MPKISVRDAQIAEKLLKQWPASERLTWKAFQTRLKPKLRRSVGQVWSRQALSAHEGISDAFHDAKTRESELKQPSSGKRPASYYAKRVVTLERQLEQVQKQLANLQLRHTQLAYNASLLENGTRLLLDPLP